MRLLLLTVTAGLLAGSAQAAPVSPVTFLSEQAIHNPWQVAWLAPSESAPVDLASDDGPASGLIRARLAIPVAYAPQGGEAQPTHAGATEYSDAYQTRRKIHKYASFATLPLFAVQLALGQSLYNPTTTTNANGITTLSNDGSKRSAHAAVGAGIVGLFAVNTVTGAWNLFGEGRSDPNGRTLRLVHGLLMMAADVGFLATSASGPSSGGRQGALNFTTNEATHRNIAYASMSVATVGYLLMLFGSH